jgi:hypothetical protein
MWLRERIIDYCENHTEHKNPLCEQNAEFWHVTAGGTYNDHWDVKS